MPFFSVIIPTYNRAHLLKKTIDSVVGQTFTDWELIVVDDGSTDNTKEVVERVSDSRVKYFYQQNAERSAARNNGIDKATSDFICFLDSDDLWRSNHLQTFHDEILKQNYLPALYYTAFSLIFPDRTEDVIYETPQGKNPIEYVIKNQSNPSTHCIHKSILQKHRFDTSLKINEDVELCARIVSEYPLVQIPVVTVDMVIHGENTKFLFKDYISPQIKAMNVIFSNPDLKDRVSVEFKAHTYRSLHSQLINVYYEQGRYGEMNKEILRYILKYPSDKGNKPRMVLFLYHIPGGSLIKGAVRVVKSVLGKK